MLSASLDKTFPFFLSCVQTRYICISSKWSFICTSRQQHNTFHVLWYTSRWALVGRSNPKMKIVAPAMWFDPARQALQAIALPIGRKEGNVLFNDALNTFYLRLYGVKHMVKDHSGSEKGNPLPPHGLLFPINSKGYFICTIPQTGLHIPRPLLHQSWSTGWNEK